MSKQFAVVQSFGTESEVVFQDNADSVVEWLKRQEDVSGFQIFDDSKPIGMKHVSVSDFLRQHIIPEIFSQLVPKYYRMDPKTEDMLPDGRYLADGMVVLFADPDNRERPESLTDGNDWLKEKLLERNRWCKVTHFNITNSGDTAAFIGVYEDGSKRPIRMGLGYAWLVKIDSIEESAVLVTKRAAQVQDLVQNAMTIAARVVTGEAPDETKADELTDTIEQTTSKILGIL
jgi:hypothetical protein